MALKRHKRDRTEFYFIKRKGRIITKLRDSSAQFSYIIKKDVGLDEATKDFVETKYFELRLNDDSVEQLPYWKDVMKRFDEWLRQL